MVAQKYIREWLRVIPLTELLSYQKLISAEIRYKQVWSESNRPEPTIPEDLPF